MPIGCQQYKGEALKRQESTLQATPKDHAYPGELATSDDVLNLAASFHQAALLLADLGKRGDSASRAPYRYTALHAIELYLSALFLKAGHAPSRIRALQHDFLARAELAADCGLRLRKRTAEHLGVVAQTREHLIARYGPELNSTLTQLNRLEATLEEVARKVQAALAEGAPR